MSAYPSLKGEDIHPPAVFDGGCNLQVDGSYFQLLNPGTGFDVDNQHCSLDVLPIVLKEVPSLEDDTSFHASHGLGLYSISMMEDGNNTDPQCASPQLACLSVVGLPAPTKSHTCLDSVDLQVESSDAYSPCIVDIGIKMDKFEQPKSGDAAAGSLKNGGVITGMLQRQVSLKTCGKLMEVFANPGSTLHKLLSKEKSFTERVHDTPVNRWRCKRASSLDSRSIVLMFSILSSFGTLVLIYLTLRVRHAAADSFGSA